MRSRTKHDSTTNKHHVRGEPRRVLIEPGAPTVTIEVPPHGQPPRIRTPRPRRLGHLGPGVPMWSQRGKPSDRRENWAARLAAATYVTQTAKVVGAYLGRC